MCGRFVTGECDSSELVRRVEHLSGLGPVADRGRGPDQGSVADRGPVAVTGWNIKPTQPVTIVANGANDGGLFAAPARWWFVPHWHRGDAKAWTATTFNAKLETARDKPAFRGAWPGHRCLIPAAGYYEWTGARGAKRPWVIRPRSNAPLFCFAGLWSQLADGQLTCTILTRPAAPGIAHLHSRMPVILPVSGYGDWLAATGEDDQVIAGIGTGWDYDTVPVRRFGLHDDGPALIERDGLAL